MPAHPTRFAAAPHRLDALSDGVFAIVLTLLALELRLPEGATADGFMPVFAENAPLLENFFVSFFVVGVLWRLHHMVSDQMPRGAPYANALTLAFLATVTLTPWSLDNLTSFPRDPMAVTTFSAILLASWLLLIAMLSLALPALEADDPRQVNARRVRVGLLAGPLVAVASILLAQISPSAALYAWLLLAPVSIVMRRRLVLAERD